MHDNKRPISKAEAQAMFDALAESVRQVDAILDGAGIPAAARQKFLMGLDK